MSPDQEFGQAYARSQIERHRNPFRRFIKALYVARILRHVEGPTVDLGCGAGQILERLPQGSIGMEVNPFLVEYLKQRRLQVLQVSGGGGGINLNGLEAGKYKSLVLSHVLEHFIDANLVLRQLLQDCSKLGITTVIVVVPGVAGFRSDVTHKTFVDLGYLRHAGLDDCEGFHLTHHSYFPGNFEVVGRLFLYHELMLVFRSKR